MCFSSIAISLMLSRHGSTAEADGATRTLQTGFDGEKQPMSWCTATHAADIMTDNVAPTLVA